ncbi:hypothetical protein Sjap_000963 [Stephania japonica]|uniref:non-specific serine/threonine protein kinase n=1 Tax=Stephania japonica TaxID=461633 RepID=A0AAP0KKN0_9MAGN
MGRVTRWFKKLFDVKKKKIYIEERENSMRRSVDQPPNIPADISAIDAAWLRSFYPELEEHKKHIANVTAATALKIQTCYRRYLARKAVVALKELEMNKGRTTNTCCCNTPMPNPTPREETEYASSSSSTTELNSGEYFFIDLTFCRISSMSSNIDNNYSFGENDQLVQELSNFRLLRWLGSGSSGIVYLCQLYGPSIGSPNENLYAMKVVDRVSLASRNKLQRAEIEKEILGMLHHPFLPTLYAQFDSYHYSCFVMEYCPGGDLHNVRLRQPNRRFNVSSAKFYAAETFLALEYLHIMGIVYRDLKPENVLVRDDGHIMLSDFDLSLKCASRFKTGENIRKRLHIPSCASQIQ